MVVAGQTVEYTPGVSAFAGDYAGRTFRVLDVAPGPPDVPAGMYAHLTDDITTWWTPVGALRPAAGTSTPPLEWDPQRPRLTPGQLLALDALYLAGAAGLTDFELAERTGRKQTSIGKRRLELAAHQLVERRQVTRPSDTLSPASVWAITSIGVDVYRRLHPQQKAVS